MSLNELFGATRQPAPDVPHCDQTHTVSVAWNLDRCPGWNHQPGDVAEMIRQQIELAKVTDVTAADGRACATVRAARSDLREQVETVLFGAIPHYSPAVAKKN